MTPHETGSTATLAGARRPDGTGPAATATRIHRL